MSHVIPISHIKSAPLCLPFQFPTNVYPGSYQIMDQVPSIYMGDLNWVLGFDQAQPQQVQTFEE